MAKPAAPKKKKQATDATMRNVRASQKRDEKLARRLDAIEHAVVTILRWSIRTGSVFAEPAKALMQELRTAGVKVGK